MRRIRRDRAILAGVSLLALLAGGAYAQDRDHDRGEHKKGDDSTVVIVTAMKRSQSTLAVPAAVTAISGNELKAEGITQVDDIQNVAPSVNVSRNGFGIATNIRGVTTTDQTSKGEQGVAFNIDGIYYGRPIQQGTAFFDVQRVEVLRGPVGTLYGKASTGGAMNIITNKPSLTGFDANATVDVASFNTRRIDGMINIPLGDKWAIRVAASDNKRDGYLTPVGGTAANGFYTSANGLPALNDEDDQSARFAVLFKPNDDLSVRVTATGGHIGGYGLGEGVGDIMDAAGDKGKAALGIVPDPIVTKQDNNFLNFDGEVDYRLGAVAITYQAAAEHFNAHDPVPSTYNPVANDYDDVPPLPLYYQLSDNRWNLHTVSHELRFANADAGPIDYVIGANYVKENIHEASHAWNVPVASPLDTSTWGNALDFLNKTIHSSVGLFGQATWHATSNLDLVLGLRESDDKLTRVGVSAIGPVDFMGNPWLDAAGHVCAYPAQCIGTPNDGSFESKKLTYRAGMNYHLSQTDMIYGSVSTGYKAGGFNDYDPRTGGPTPYAPESMTAYEVGYKGKPLGNLVYSTSLFYYDYQGDQISSRVIINGTTVVYTRLVPATIEGWENELNYRLSSHTELGLSTTMERSKYKRLMAGIFEDTDWAGKSLDQTPDLAATGKIMHRFDLPGGATLRARGLVKYSSGYELSDFVNAVQFKQKPFTRSDFSLTFEPAHGHYSLEAYVQNIENKIQKVGPPENYQLNLATFQVTPNSTTFPVSMPRVFGVRLSVYY